MMRRVTPLLCLIVCACFAMAADKKSKHTKGPDRSLNEYLQQFSSQEIPATPQPVGSLWTNGSNFSDLCTDYRSHRLGEAIQIQIVEQTLMSASATVNNQRAFSTSSAVTSLPGRMKTGGINPLLGANSGTTLKGSGQTSRNSSLQTTLTGQIVAVLPNGSLVVEARRDVLMNNERQVLALRGLVRPGDVSSENSVLSTQLANLEVEVKGRGIISDATHQPNIFMRLLLKLVEF
ncbi:MAG TPA: flagellar basal body L-ring protein FlgH [Terriglobales bacterium]